MPELIPLHADHAPALLAFEVANRAYFAAAVSDRGEGYFARFEEVHRAALAEQASGECAFYLLVEDGDGGWDEDGAILGRFNLFDLVDGGANLGYRVAERAAGRGVASATVRRLCRLAAVRHGLHTLRAAASHRNTPSHRVLLNAGFTPDGPAGPADLGGKEGTWYRRELGPEPGLDLLVPALTGLAAEPPVQLAWLARHGLAPDELALDFEHAHQCAQRPEVLAELAAIDEVLRAAGRSRQPAALAADPGWRQVRALARQALTELLGTWRLPLTGLRGGSRTG